MPAILSSRLRPWFAALCVALALALVLAPATARADDACVGPAECCPSATVDSLPARQTVAIGVVLLGVGGVSERAGTWDADYYLFEAWSPTPGFVPHTEVVNEVSRGNEQPSGVALRGGRCVRSRRIRSTLRTEYDLRAFPFDHQQLTMRFSDARYDDASLIYAPRAFVAQLDAPARRQLAAWSAGSDVLYAPRVEAFAWSGSPRYAYATFTVAIHRHVTYHLAKYFLPLLVIVAVAFAIFWIDPDDLGSATGIGVTCILAAIAFQLAQASDLPAVAYLTLADRVFVVCYCAMAAALLTTLRATSLARHGHRDRALRLAARCRWFFPATLLVALAVAVLTAFGRDA